MPGQDLPQVLLQTNLGDITLHLHAQEAPDSVSNFLGYIDAGFFDGLIFHRVISGFMIQGGGFTTEMQRKPTRPPIRNEAANGLKNRRGTIAMPRTSDPDSASSQFFINLVDNPGLDRPSPDGHGYAVFGQVIGGMDVVDQIGAVRTGIRNGMKDVPVEPVVIQSARRATAET